MRPALPTIYIAGPLSNAPSANLRLAKTFAVDLIRRGWAVFCPHLNLHIDEHLISIDAKPLPYETHRAQDFTWISKCEALFKWAPSPGADREHEFANRLHIPVFTDLKDIPHGSTFLWERETQRGNPRIYDDDCPQYIPTNGQAGPRPCLYPTPLQTSSTGFPFAVA